MAASYGIELRNITYEPGEEHTKIFADIYLDDKKIGEVLDDGWCDGLYVEFEDTKAQELFLKRKEKYCKKKNIDSLSTEDFVKSFIYRDRMIALRRGSKKSKGPLEQLTFL